MMALAPAGYSARPLHEKLGYKAGQSVLFIALPAKLGELTAAVPFLRVAEAANDAQYIEPKKRVY